MEAHRPIREKPEDFSLPEVEVRLATPEERPLRDAPADRHHYLGFRRLAARGLRYVAVWRGRRVAPAGRRGGAFKCGPRGRWIGWKPEQQFERLDPVANNTRFPVLAELRALPRLASFFLAAMTRRLGDDWLAVRGHRALVAETFCDPSRFAGTMRKAAGWRAPGRAQGYARANGRYTDPRGEPKQCLALPLRRDARRLLARAAPPPP